MKTCALFGYKKDSFNRQAYGRCKKAADLYTKGSVNKIYIAGVLGNRMKEFLKEEGIKNEDIIVSPRAHTTAGEIRLFTSAISASSRIVAVSSWYHIPRILILFRAFGRVASFKASTQGVSATDILREIPLLILALVWPKAFSNYIDE